jgi:hypothetical protein
MDCFKQVTSWHVDKLLWVEPLQMFLKEDKSHIRIMKTIKQLHTKSQGVSHVTWSPPIVSHGSAKKPNQLLSSWIALLGATLEEYHQDRIVAYQTSASSKDVFLYLKHEALCHSCNFSAINYFVCLSSDWVQWNKQVHSLSTIFMEASPKPYIMQTTFQLTCALIAR